MARICLRWFSKPPLSGTRDNGSLDRCRDIEAVDSEPKAWFYQEAETERNTFALEFARRRIWKTRGGRSAIQKLLNERKLIARHLTSMGEIQGTLCISRLLNFRNRKLVITHSGRPELRNVSQFVVLIVQF